MAGTLTNNGNIVHRGSISLNPGETVENYGIFLFAGGGMSSYGDPIGEFNNHPTGMVKVDDDGGYASMTLNNHGMLTTYNGLGVPVGTFNNFETGVVESYLTNLVWEGEGRVFQGSIYNCGGLIDNYGDVSMEGGNIINEGTFNNYARIALQVYPSGMTILNREGATFNNFEDGEIYINARNGGYHRTINNLGTFNNEGTIINEDSIQNQGIFNNNGLIENDDTGPEPVATIDNHGTFNNNEDGEITNDSVINNQATGTMNNDGTITNVCGGVFNNSGTYNGNPVVEDCVTFPIVHMEDTTASAGYGVYVSKPGRAEYVTPNSQLVGDEIDSITLKLKRVGTISGTAEIGVFNSDLSVKKLFGTLDVSTLTTAYADYEFNLTGDELYTIEAGDRIGIKYTGGSATTWVAVMLDLDSADPFDGANSYAQYYQGSWLSTSDRDLYMILKQTHG